MLFRLKTLVSLLSVSLKMSDIEDGNFEGRVIGREGIEEFNPRMWKNIQECQKAFENVYRAER